MAGIIELFRRLVVRSGDVNLLDHGSITTPQQATGTAITGAPVVKRTISLAAGATLTLWDWTVDGDFALFLIECDSFVWIAQKVDKPTASDGSNNAPAGTDVNYPKEGLSCIGPMLLQGMAVPVVPSATNYAGSAFHATTEAGRRYAVYAKNPGATAVNLTIAWAK